jgi:hypothetical protein
MNARNQRPRIITKTTALWSQCYTLAVSLIPECVEMNDGEKCFNLYAYLDRLSDRLVTVLDGSFELDPMGVARFLWCCLSEDPAGNTFQGMPILD